MKLAPFSGRLAPAFNPFDEDYLVEILNAVIEAWSRMIQPERHELEDQITFRLAGWIANDPTLRDLPYDVVPQNWLLGLNGELLGRLDLRFKHRNSARDYFAFEAKRLHVTYPSGTFRPEYSNYTGKGRDDVLHRWKVREWYAGGRNAGLRDGWRLRSCLEWRARSD